MLHDISELNELSKKDLKIWPWGLLSRHLLMGKY